MSNFKNIEFLHRNRIIYRRLPINDVPTETYDWGYYYENGTHECFELFNSEAKISTYRSLMWHLLVIRYLNQDIDSELLIRVFEFISDRRNGFVTFDVPRPSINNIIKDVMDADISKPPNNKIRKVIFKPFTGLSRSEKMSIVGSIMGRSTKISYKSICDAMDEVNRRGEKITLNSLSKEMSCSIKSIQRNVGDDFNERKQKLNLSLRKKRRRRG